MSTQRRFKEMEQDLELRLTEVKVKDEQLKRQFAGSDENLSLFKEQE